MIQHRIATLIELRNEMAQEAVERSIIKHSKEYEALERVINSAKTEQIEMLKTVSDATEDYNHIKQGILDYYKQNRSYHNDNIERKFKTKRKVNPHAVIEALGGDFGRFTELVKISQKDLKEYAKDDKPLEESLINCIEIESREFTDISINPQ